MTIANFAFDPATGYQDTVFAPTNPASELQFRATMQAIPDQLRDFINLVLLPVVNALPTTSDVLTKTNTTSYSPTTQYHPATKGYVDTTVSGVIAGTIPDNSLTEIKMANEMKKGIVGGVAAYNDTLSTGGGLMDGDIDMNDNEIKRAKIKDYSEVVTVLTNQTGTVNLDLSLGNNFAIASMIGNIAITLSNWPTSGIDYPIKIEIVQGGTVRAVTFPSSFKFTNGTAPNVAQASKKSVITGYSRDGGTTVICGALVGIPL